MAVLPTPGKRFLLICLISLAAMLPPATQAQSPATTAQSLPDEPGHQPGGSISGIVVDPHGAILSNAVIILQADNPKSQQSLTADANGFFYVPALPPGSYRLTITAPGFAPITTPGITLHLNEIRDLHNIALRVATASTSVNVTFTREQLAEEELRQEEKQRVLAVFPNFFVTYNWNAPPLTAKQKFRLALRSATDPAAFLGAGFAAGFEQWADEYHDYGQGMDGYAKRFGASYGDAFNGTMLGGAVFPSLFHQDPRYFYKGTGTIRSRILYAISTVVICKGDNGKWQPNYSNVLGAMASAGLSNLYYPSADRHGPALTIRNSLIGTASGSVGALFQEFLIKKISKGVPPPVPNQPVNQYQKPEPPQKQGSGNSLP